MSLNIAGGPYITGGLGNPSLGSAGGTSPVSNPASPAIFALRAELREAIIRGLKDKFSDAFNGAGSQATESQYKIADALSEIAPILINFGAYSNVKVFTNTTFVPDVTVGIEKYLVIDATEDDCVVNLPSASAEETGRVINFKRADITANTITITPFGAETIDGDPSFLLINRLKLVSDGSNWWIFDES